MLNYGGPVLSWLWFEHGWSEAAALRLEHAAAYGLLAATPLLAWRKAWPVAAAIAGWLLLVIVATTAVGTWYPWLTPGAHATRYLAPLALVALSLQPARVRPAEWLLRVAAAATFACHGVEALLAHAQFVDYVITGGNRVGVEVAEGTARGVLLAVGLVDIGAAAAVLIPKRLRAVAAWMAVWGLATAGMRVVSLGWGNWPEVLIRVANGLVPLTLLMLWRRDASSE